MQMNTPPNKLRAVRILHGYNPKEVVEYIGLRNEKILINWEKGKSFPTTLQLLKLSVLYHTLPSELYYELHKKFVSELKEKMKLQAKK